MFRNPLGIRQEISLHIDGNLQSPEIHFFLDGEHLETTEAISFLVFGHSAEFLSEADRDAVLYETSNLQAGLTLLVGHAATQLSQIIQNQLRLDLLEIRGDTQFQEASVTVGTYIRGTNIFVSYETGIDFADERTWDPGRVSFEYQINRFLLLTATQSAANESGLDLIIRLQRR